MAGWKQVDKLLWDQVETGSRKWLYALLDCRKDPNLYLNAVKSGLRNESLVGPGDKSIIPQRGPHLIRLRKNTQFMKWVLEKGWGKGWAIFLISRLPIRDLRNTLRSIPGSLEIWEDFLPNPKQIISNKKVLEGWNGEIDKIAWDEKQGHLAEVVVLENSSSHLQGITLK